MLINISFLGGLMKKALMKLGVITTMVSLGACSTNTQNENTGVGAVTGAIAGGLAGSLIGGGTGKVIAIGTGIVAGALIGGSIGRSMEHSDNVRMSHALNNPTNTSTTWINQKTNTHYTVTPTSGRLNVNGNPNCRQFNTTAVINNKMQQVTGIACQQSDGSWKAIRS